MASIHDTTPEVARRRKQRSRRSPKSAPIPDSVSAAGEVFSPPSPPQLDEQTEGVKKPAEGLGACDRPETTGDKDEQDIDTTEMDACYSACVEDGGSLEDCRTSCYPMM